MTEQTAPADDVAAAPAGTLATMVQYQPNWRKALVPAEIDVVQLCAKLESVILPRKMSAEDRIDVVERMKETLEEKGIAGLLEHDPIVLHQATGQLLDGAARVSAIAGYHVAAKALDGEPVPVMYHVGSLAQAVADVLGESVKDPQRRTTKDRLEALRTYLTTAQLVNEPPMSQSVARGVFHIRPIDVQRVYRELGVETTIGRNAKRYQAAKTLASHPGPAGAIAAAERRLDSQMEDDLGDDAQTPTWSARGFAGKTPPEGAIPADTLNAAADAEDVTAALIAAINDWLRCRDRAEATSGSLLALLSSKTASELHSAASALHDALRFERRRSA